MLSWVKHPFKNSFRFSETNHAMSIFCPQLRDGTLLTLPAWDENPAEPCPLSSLLLTLSQLSHCLNKQNSMSRYNHHDILNIIGCANGVIITLIHSLISKYFSVNTKLPIIQQISGICNCGHIIFVIYNLPSALVSYALILLRL